MPFPRPAPAFYLVEIPPDARPTTASQLHTIVEQRGARMKRVDQHALLVQLLVRATPAMRALAARVFNDPESPEWKEYK